MVLKKLYGPNNNTPYFCWANGSRPGWAETGEKGNRCKSGAIPVAVSSFREISHFAPVEAPYHCYDHIVTGRFPTANKPEDLPLAYIASTSFRVKSRDEVSLSQERPIHFHSASFTGVQLLMLINTSLCASTNKRPVRVAMLPLNAK